MLFLKLKCLRTFLFNSLSLFNSNLITTLVGWNSSFLLHEEFSFIFHKARFVIIGRFRYKIDCPFITSNQSLWIEMAESEFVCDQFPDCLGWTYSRFNIATQMPYCCWKYCTCLLSLTPGCFFYLSFFPPPCSSIQHPKNN